MSFDSARDVMQRKSIWMVEYLRGRRLGDNLTGFYRRKFLAERRTHLQKEPRS